MAFSRQESKEATRHNGTCVRGRSRVDTPSSWHCTESRGPGWGRVTGLRQGCGLSTSTYVQVAVSMMYFMDFTLRT